MMLNQPDNTPLVLRRTDLVRAVAPVLKEVVPDNDGNDFGELMAFIERFSGHFSKIVGMVQQLQGVAGRQSMPAMPEPGPMPEPAPRVEPAPMPEPQTPRITALHIYQICLGKMAQAPQDMTMGDALSMAKLAKSQVLGEIQRELDAFYESGQ